jgi:hypothetical protein
VHGKRPSQGTTPTNLLGLHQNPGPDPVLFHGSPVQRVGSCFEPYVNIGPRRRHDAVGPGPSVLANSSSVLTPVKTCTRKPRSQNDRGAAGLVFHDAGQLSLTIPTLPTGSLSSSLNTLQLASLDVDPSCSSLLDDSAAKHLAPGSRSYDNSPSATAIANSGENMSPCFHHAITDTASQLTITPIPTIITDGSHVLEVSPRSLVTPRQHQPAAPVSAQPAIRKESTAPLRAADSWLLPNASIQGPCPYRRRVDSPSDDEANDSPGLHGGLLTPQCMPAVSFMQCSSPAEHQAATGSAGSAGRLVCNLIERFNNTQLYDGINESPQLTATHLVYPEAEEGGQQV